MDLNYLKEKLQAKEDMLAHTTDFLIQIQNNLEEKNTELQLANKDIFDSISFASLIQNALLPDVEVLKIFFKDASYKVMQKIGIGGDSVFVKNTNKGVVFGLLDSTGHGIPAALLSISGTLLLKELMTAMEIDNPKTLFNLLNYQLHNAFSNNKSSIAHQEGVIFSYSSTENRLTYSSAKGKALLLHTNGEIDELVNTKNSIGDDLNSEFELFKIDVVPGDKLIIHSDGLTDQFGGSENKKFSRKRLKKFLNQLGGDNASTISKKIEDEFTLWKNNNKQTDDVSFIVIEF